MRARPMVCVRDRTVVCGDRSVELPDYSGRVAAERIAEAIRAVYMEATGEIMLAIPLSWCYVQVITVPQRRPKHVALVFALEEFLPIEAERLTCDFVRIAPGRFLGVAVETDRLVSLVERLALEGLQIGSIVPESFIIARDASGDQIVCDCDHMVYVQLDGSRIGDVRGVRLPEALDVADWAETIVAQLGDCDRPFQVYCAGPDSWRIGLAERIEQDVLPPSPSIDGRTHSAAACDLAHGALAPAVLNRARDRSNQRLAIILCAALLMIAGGLGWKTSRIESQRADIARWHKTTFSDVFRGEAVPRGIRLRVASERKRLEALKNVDQVAPGSLDALEILQHVIAALPEGVRARFDELRIEDGRITLRGLSRSHADADALARGLDEAPSIQCPPARSDRDRNAGVRFFLQARLATEQEHADES